MTEGIDGTVQAILNDSASTDDESEAHAIAYEKTEDAQRRAELAKSAPHGSISKMEFEVTTEGSVGTIHKSSDDFVIWGPASVEVIDKERDRIKADALETALPQLLKRRRLSYEHRDQIVGDILERFSTDEPVTVKINGNEYTRTEFPTDVLKLDGMKPALYVAGNVYNDTQKSQEVRKKIEAGEVDSYSISGEAVVTEMAVKNGQTFTDILKIDLSATTLCREGMNQKAEFDLVSKQAEEPMSLNPPNAANLAKSRIQKTMGNNDNDNDSEVQKFVDALDTTLDKRLPDGEIATKEDVDEMVEEKLEAKGGSPKEGTSDRPDGESHHSQEMDPDYEGDNPDNTASDPDKVEEKGYSMDELKSILPDDQYKAIAPKLKEDMGGMDEGPDVNPEEDKPAEEVMPDEEPEMPDEEGMEDPGLKNKAVDNLDWDRLSEEQKKSLAKSDSVEKADSQVRASSGVGGSAEPAHAGDESDFEKAIVEKASNEEIAKDPAMRKVYDENGEPLI